MAELNEKAKAEIEEIFAKVSRKVEHSKYKGGLPILKKAVAKHIGLLKEGVPPCYLAFLYDELNKIVGPVFRLDACEFFTEVGKCDKGFKLECDTCPEYKPCSLEIGAGIDCDSCPFPERKECEK